LIKHLDKVPDDEIAELNVPTGLSKEKSIKEEEKL
jgi:bisphosphoglycerate-dependent phosphoglycerate mutase